LLLVRININDQAGKVGGKEIGTYPQIKPMGGNLMFAVGV